MKRPPIAPLIAITLVAGLGYYVDQKRRVEETKLSGFFESQPTDVVSRQSGKVKKILVQEGQTVEAGQALVELEADAAALNAVALNRAEQQAKANYEKAAKGNRPEDIARQAAVVTQARAALAKLMNGSRPEEIAQANERLRQAQSRLVKLQNGNRPEEVAQAKAIADQALARYQELVRGPTQEEKSQLEARLQQARAAEDQARSDAERYRALFGQGAASQQRMELAVSNYDQAKQRSKDAAEALRRSLLGNTNEVKEQARQAYLAAQAQYKVVAEGPRAEDIEAARQDVNVARETVLLVEKPSRAEDIAAAKGRLAAEEALLKELKAGSRTEDLKSAEAQYQAAQAQYQAAKVLLDERTIRAGRNGRVEALDLAVGDYVTPSRPVARIQGMEDLWLKVYVSESQLSKIKLGDTAQIKLDGVSQPIEGVVSFVSSSGEFTPANLQAPDERGRQVFAIKIRPKANGGQIHAGAYASVVKVGAWP